MEIHHKHSSEWRYSNILRRPGNLCVIWLRWGYTVYSKTEWLCVVSYKFIFLFLCLTLAASEGRVNGGEDFFQKVSV